MFSRDMMFILCGVHGDEFMIAKTYTKYFENLKSKMGVSVMLKSTVLFIFGPNLRTRILV